MDLYQIIVQFFQQGGFFMYPIALILAVGLAIALERFIYLSKARISNRSVLEKLLPMLQKGRYQEVVSLSQKSTAHIGKILAAGVARLQVSPRREDVEYAMEEGFLEAMHHLDKRTAYLATLANVVTLLGLLGTIIGLIAAFSAVATAEPSQKATLLSQSISVAMNTTAFGLISAIPLLLIHAYLQARTTEIVDSFEMASVKFLNLIAETGAMPFESRQGDQQ